MKESFRVHMKTISHGAHIISKKLVFFQKGLYFPAYYDIMCLFLSKREFRRDFRDFRDFRRQYFRYGTGFSRKGYTHDV
ncbi:hypothetical protein RUMCAL_00643 [Ruminococcus callidus ATCC 27760]|uniref:Uncharacterized protein n=1 Tax=Ruminococcus callidus ATCC 27760 TaxID=411473 RepID=U2M5H5_9FIRM|nr:hypothetical protein RUMCAL_00643 [Ruminococcus callidus ATCC 27760]